ncbi:hypothetical protein [Flavihumibacter profundi]|uniref:hypothetical protein n=1 Tax=Flavihumibacter profundi TaxID=2716883 RepID=UPI001CC40535|nr:hypothetical protein [Flavihumibacter profundi]MBZ5859236.1 hypothetical protein [Flavihumibacter profundi]
MNINSNMQMLSMEELENISGGGTGDGSLLDQFAFFVGATAKSIYEFCTTSMEYQASLPANLKK